MKKYNVLFLFEHCSITSGALEKIAAKIDSMAEDSFLNIIESDRTELTDIKEMSQIIIVVEKDIGKGSFLFRIIMMRKVEKG